MKRPTSELGKVFKEHRDERRDILRGFFRSALGYAINLNPTTSKILAREVCVPHIPHNQRRKSRPQQVGR